MSSIPNAVAAALVASLLPLGAASAPIDPLASYRWHWRVLLVSAPDDADPGLARQRRAFQGMRDGARERDLVLVEAVGDTPRARALRDAFGLDPALFTALLIGKDGGAKLRSTIGLGPSELFPTIDAMPMRRDEMTRAAP